MAVPKVVQTADWRVVAMVAHSVAWKAGCWADKKAVQLVAHLVD